MSSRTPLRDWAARTQGADGWAAVVEQNNIWLGMRIGFIVGSVTVLPVFALFVLFVMTR